AEVVEVDAPTGLGVDDLRAALDRLLAATPLAADVDRPRLWVDRSFAARGSGTVVTGTLAKGTVAVDDELVLIGDRHPPAGTRVRVRALQTHAEGRDRVEPGNRLAVNLTGVSHHDVVRGNALVRPGQWAPTTRFDGSVRVLESLDHDVSRRGAYQLYAGSGEYPVRVRVLGREAVVPRGEGLVRLHLP